LEELKTVKKEKVVGAAHVSLVLGRETDVRLMDLVSLYATATLSPATTMIQHSAILSPSFFFFLSFFFLSFFFKKKEKARELVQVDGWWQQPSFLPSQRTRIGWIERGRERGGVVWVGMGRDGSGSLKGGT